MLWLLIEIGTILVVIVSDDSEHSLRLEPKNVGLVANPANFLIAVSENKLRSCEVRLNIAYDSGIRRVFDFIITFELHFAFADSQDFLSVLNKKQIICGTHGKKLLLANYRTT